MLKLENEEYFDDFWGTHHSQFGVKDYLQDVLLPLVKAGDWNELEKLPVLFADDGTPLIMFKDNCWDFSDKREDLFGKNGNIHFTYETAKGQNKTRKGKILERNIANEIKSFTLLELFFSHKKIAVRSLITPVNKLVYCASFMLSQGVNTFDGLDLEQLLEYVHNGLDLSEKGAKTITTLNRLAEMEEFLPFKTNLNEKLTTSALSVVTLKSNQYPVIPPRIYIGLVQEFSNLINNLYKYRAELEAAVEQVLQYKERAMKIAIHKLRHKKYSIGSYILPEYKDDVLKAFRDAGIPFIDYEKHPDWETLWNSLQPGLNYIEIAGWQPISVGDYSFSEASVFYDFISRLDHASKWLLMALSGMRIDELWRMSPVDGLQEYKTGKNTICLVTTKQSKISLTSQTKNDVYVTTESGKKAFEILNAIHSPYRKRFERNSHRMFASIIKSNWHEAANKAAMGKSLIDKTNAHPLLKQPLSKQDCEYLRVSDPTRNDFVVGEQFNYNNHQLRRSFAYYLIGYELLSFPQLKQQLGHLSLEMTRWYALNASSFQKIYREVASERNKQQAEVLARIYNRMANKERIAGGLGLALTDLVTKEGKLHFEKTENKRKLSSEYWETEIKANRAHIHAIAPGMYCTKRECDMRISIDLSECVDCSWDLIENVVFAETARMDAMRNLLFLHDSGELNKSAASKYIMQIRSAEKIMTNIGFEFEKFTIPAEAEAMLIEVSEVA